jgi:polysaccharide export outer membrane protein
MPFLPALLRTTLLTASLCCALACAPTGSYVWVNELPPQEPPAEPNIQPRDSLMVEVRNQTTLSGEFLVREDGHYLQPMVGNIKVQGLTPSAVAIMLSGLLKGIVVDPRVSVFVSKPAPIRVNVVGEVKTPGTYELNRDRSVLGALSAAGWITDFASRDRIFVVRPADRQRVRFSAAEITASPDGPSGRFRLHDGDSVVVE